MLHGEYVHIYQIAFMFQQKSNIQLRQSRNLSMVPPFREKTSDENTTFNPGHDGWVALFDQ